MTSATCHWLLPFTIVAGCFFGVGCGVQNPSVPTAGSTPQNHSNSTNSGQSQPDSPNEITAETIPCVLFQEASNESESTWIASFSNGIELLYRTGNNLSPAIEIREQIDCQSSSRYDISNGKQRLFSLCVVALDANGIPIRRWQNLIEGAMYSSDPLVTPDSSTFTINLPPVHNLPEAYDVVVIYQEISMPTEEYRRQFTDMYLAATTASEGLSSGYSHDVTPRWLDVSEVGGGAVRLVAYSGTDTHALTLIEGQ